MGESQLIKQASLPKRILVTAGTTASMITQHAKRFWIAVDVDKIENGKLGMPALARRRLMTAA